MNVQIRGLKKMVPDQSGFTLVEVLVTAVIMAVGLLAIAQLQVIGIKMNACNRGVTEATLLAAAQLEYLRNLPFDPPSNYPILSSSYPLADDSTINDLEEISGTPDHVHPDYPIDHDGYPVDSTQVRYGLFWNVADNTPAVSGRSAKTIAVIVTWLHGPRRSKKHVALETVIARWDKEE